MGRKRVRVNWGKKEQSEYDRNIRKQRIQNGLCRDCQVENNNGKKRCNSCLQKCKDNYLKRKASGKCVHCLKTKKLITKTFCQKCVNQHKNYQLLKNYGITSKQYQEMLKAQNNKCAISGIEHSEDRPLVVDHNHDTNRVRQLIDTNINKALGLFQENTDWLRKAAEYLEKHGQ